MQVLRESPDVLQLVPDDSLAFRQGEQILDVTAFREELFELIHGELPHLAVPVLLYDLHLFGGLEEFDHRGRHVQGEPLKTLP